MPNLSDDHAAELDRLNAAIKQAVQNRTEWLDNHMAEYAKYAIGDPIYDLESGECVGEVCGYYRFHASQKDWRFDDSLSISYNFRKPSEHSCIDNTSSQPYKLGTKAEVVERLRSKMSRLGVSDA